VLGPLLGAKASPGVRSPASPSGAGYVRMALVESAARCAQAAGRIRDLLAAPRETKRKTGGAGG